jgi:hypothetical protein
VGNGGTTYLVCAYIYDDIGTAYSPDTISNGVRVTIPPQQCGPGAHQDLRIANAPTVAYHRNAPIYVSEPGLSASASDLFLTMKGVHDKHPFFTYHFDGGDMNRLATDSPEEFYANFNPGDGPATITISYVTGANCITSVSSHIRPVLGVLPQVSFPFLTLAFPAGGTILFNAPGGCPQTRVVPATISITGRGANFIATTKDECSGKWVQRGHAAGVSTITKQTPNGDAFGFNPHDVNATYSVTVSLNKHVVKRGLLVLDYQHQDPYKVWQGTDAFVNYCINGLHQTYSQNLQLYCWHSGYTNNDMFLKGQ